MINVKNLIRRNISSELFAYLVQNNILFKLVNNSGGGKIDNYSPKEMARYCKNVYQLYLNHGLELKGKKVLEVGPGRSLGISLLFVLGGAKKVYAIDRFNCLSPRDDLVLKHLSPKYEYYMKQIEYITLPIEYLNDKKIGKVDLIVSNAVIEHVNDIEHTFRNLYSLLSPSGIMIHKVDLRAHNRFLKGGPLYFLKYSNFLWKMMGNNIGAPNRMRFPDYKDILKKYGFEFKFKIDEYFNLSGVEKARETYLKGTRFSNMTLHDLSIATFWIVGKLKI
jgi:SAM-dependent methyltransferase